MAAELPAIVVHSISEIVRVISNEGDSIYPVNYNLFPLVYHHTPGADCNLGPTWEQNSRTQRKKFFCSRVSLKCSQIEVFWGQLGMFQGQYTV